MYGKIHSSLAHAINKPPSSQVRLQDLMSLNTTKIITYQHIHTTASFALWQQ